MNSLIDFRYRDFCRSTQTSVIRSLLVLILSTMIVSLSNAQYQVVYHGISDMCVPISQHTAGVYTGSSELNQIFNNYPNIHISQQYPNNLSATIRRVCIAESNYSAI